MLVIRYFLHSSGFLRTRTCLNVVNVMRSSTFMKHYSREFFGNLIGCWKRSGKRNYQIVKPGIVSPIREVPNNIEKPSYVVTKKAPPIKKYVDIKTEWQIEKMKEAGLLAREILDLAASYVKPGITTDEIDKAAHEAIIAHNAYPSPLLYRGFPKSICVSVNNVACHGIPDDRLLVEGDILNIDVTVYYNGYHGDCSETFIVGETDETALKLVEAARQSRDEAIAVCKPGEPLSTIGKTISKIASQAGFQVVPAFCGHGIGTYFHGPPDIFHFANDFWGVMVEGMTFTIEPVLSEGSDEIITLEDGWTAVSVDHSRSAQFEHTILITKKGAEILTQR